MATYNISTSSVVAVGQSATLFRVGFGEPAQNDAIVRETDSRLTAIFDEDGSIGTDSELSIRTAGSLALINGPASLPVALVIGHALGHRYGAIGVFDPKMSAYVVAVAHGGEFKVGDLIPAASVAETA